MSELVEEAEEILETAEAEAKKFSKKVTGAITKVGGAYKYAWFTCLGTALTMEEKLTDLGKEVEGKLVDFGKKMADKGSKAKMASPSALLVKKIEKKLDAPKAKLESATAEIKTKAQTTFTDVEEVLDKGVKKSLNFIGVPSRKDMDQMTSLMKDMAESISELSSQLADQKTTKTTRKSTAKTSADQTSAA